MIIDDRGDVLHRSRAIAKLEQCATERQLLRPPVAFEFRAAQIVARSGGVGHPCLRRFEQRPLEGDPRMGLAAEPRPRCPSSSTSAQRMVGTPMSVVQSKAAILTTPLSILLPAANLHRRKRRRVDAGRGTLRLRPMVPDRQRVATR